MVLLQKLFIFVLNPILGIKNKLDQKKQNFIIYVFACILMALYLLWHSYPVLGISTTKNNEMLLGCGVIAIILILSLKDKLVRINWNRFVPVALSICAIWMLGMSFLHPIGPGFRAIALTILVGFPALYFVWGNREDYQTLYLLISKAFSHVLTGYFLICMIFLPAGIATSGRYTGSTVNPNIWGMLCVAAAVCVFFVISETKGKTILLYFFSLWVAVTGVAYSGSRTAFLIILIQSIIFGCYYLRHKILRAKDKMKGIAVLLALLLIIISAVVLPSYVGSQITVNTATEPQAEELENSVEEASALISVLDRLENQDSNLDAMSSGRLSLWKTYLENLNLTGHNGNQLLYVSRFDRSEWAHNTALEYAYRCGFIPGVLFLLVEIYAGIYVLIWLFSKKYEPWRLFSMLGIISFCCYSVLDVLIYPFEHVIMFLFFIAIMPLYKKKSRKDKFSETIR